MRLAVVRNDLRLSQGEAARKIGIPKSTLSNYELCVVPLRAELALRICRKLILSEEWLATGSFKLTEQAGKTKKVAPSDDLKPFYIRQCMDLLGSPEATRLPHGLLFSEAFDRHLAPVFEQRIRANFYFVGIPSTAWVENDIELGADLTQVLIERLRLLLQNEALRRGTSAQHAGATYLGFIMRMAFFGFKKCTGEEISLATVSLPEWLFTDPKEPILAFKSAEELSAAKDSPEAVLASH